MSLLKTRRFLPLLITQFLGAFNDNLFKNALLTLVAIKMTAQSAVLSNVIAGLFILPFFLFLSQDYSQEVLFAVRHLHHTS